MAKRTQTSKGMRTKLRSVNRTNESLGADLKAVRVALYTAHELINELEGVVASLQAEAEQTKEKSDDEPTAEPVTEGADS